MKCFYHSADLDGKCSGAIVYSKYNKMCEMFGYDYAQKFPMEEISAGETIIMVDIAIQPNELMHTLNNMCDLVWIDHHTSAIKASEEEPFEFNNARGIRDINFAACELTCKFFYGNVDVPYAVRLLGLYDIWKQNQNEDALPFQYGMKVRNTSVESNLWLDLFNADKTSKIIRDIIADGKTIIKYETKQNESICRFYSFEFTFEKYKCISINKNLPSSIAFNSIYDESKHDIMFAFNRKSNIWSVSLYTTKSNIDVSEIAKRYGGGGHKQAAGFNIPDINLIIPMCKNL